MKLEDMLESLEVSLAIDNVKQDLLSTYGPYLEFSGIVVFRKWFKHYLPETFIKPNIKKLVFRNPESMRLLLRSIILDSHSELFKKYTYKRRDGKWVVIRPAL